MSCTASSRSRALGAAAMIDAAGLAWTVEQHPLEAVLDRECGSRRGFRCRAYVANVRSDTRAVLGVVGEGYEPLQNRAAFAFCDAITDSGEAHWLGAAETRGGARVHALMQLDREIRIGDAEGEDVLPLLCFRNGHDGGLAVTISVAPFRLACLNGMMLPLDGRAADVEGAAHREPRRAARGRAADARDRLALLRRAGGARRAADPRADERGASSSASSRSSCRCPSHGPTRRDGGRAVRNVERVREAIATAYRATPDLANISGTRWGALQAVTAYVDHVQPTRATAGRSHQEARFERATEPRRSRTERSRCSRKEGTQS